MRTKTKKSGSDMPKRFWDDQEWGYAHYGELAKRYGNQWVVIVNRKAVAASHNLREAEETARAKTGEAHVPVIFVERGGRVFNFASRN